MDVLHRSFAPADAARLVREGLSPLMARLYAARGVSSVAGNSELAAPDTMLNALKAAELLVQCTRQGMDIVVVADYDADGATACAVKVRTFRAWGASVNYVVPNRQVHGYGLTPSIVDLVRKVTPRKCLVVTVDNGIASYDGVLAAKAAGMEVLITDHHLPAADREDLPAAACIVNPNQLGDKFVSRFLAGCGVAWYVCFLYDSLMRSGGHVPPADPAFTMDRLLPLVGLGTIADVVPLDGNNRELVLLGLALIHDDQAPVGLRALIAASNKLPAALTCSDIAFSIAPKINAAGRLDDMSIGIECLLCDDRDEASYLAAHLDTLNRQRKEIETETAQEAIAEAMAIVREDTKSITLYSGSWHEGVIGIVAGRVRERMGRPTIVMTLNREGLVKASGRSIPGFHLRDALDLVSKRNPGLLLKFGGHAMAAGLTLANGTQKAFEEAFEQVSSEMITDDMLSQAILVDGSLPVDDINLRNAFEIKKRVWGQKFEEPIFLDRFIVREARRVGAGQSTLVLELSREGLRYRGVQFRSETPELRPGQPVMMAYSLDPNTFNGKTTLQLLVRAIDTDIQ